MRQDMNRRRFPTTTVSIGAGLALAGATEDSRLFGLTERMLSVTIVCWLIAVGRTVGAPSPIPA